MKKLSVIDLLLKADNGGKRKPTALAIGLVCVFVLSSYFLSQQPKQTKKKKGVHKESIIKQSDIEQATYSEGKNGEAFKIDYSTINDAKKDLQEPAKSNKRFKAQSHSKIIVFDDTKDYQSDEVVPLGSMVKCILIHNIVTNNFNAPVIAQVWEDFYFNGNLLLPFGTRIYGTAFAGRQRDRISVKFHSVVFEDGKTLKINAIGLSKDGSGGLTGTVIDHRNKKIFVQMAVNFLSGLALGLQQTATNVVSGLTEVQSNSRNAILNGVASTFQQEAKRIEKDVEGDKGYAIVLAGNELVVYFERQSDVNPL